MSLHLQLLSFAHRHGLQPLAETGTHRVRSILRWEATVCHHAPGIQEHGPKPIWARRQLELRCASAALCEATEAGHGLGHTSATTAAKVAKHTRVKLGFILSPLFPCRGSNSIACHSTARLGAEDTPRPELAQRQHAEGRTTATTMYEAACASFLVVVPDVRPTDILRTTTRALQLVGAIVLCAATTTTTAVRAPPCLVQHISLWQPRTPPLRRFLHRWRMATLWSVGALFRCICHNLL